VAGSRYERQGGPLPLSAPRQAAWVQWMLVGLLLALSRWMTMYTVDPCGNVVGLMVNPHYLEVLASKLRR
jgi:hypothetical protein